MSVLQRLRESLVSDRNSSSNNEARVDESASTSSTSILGSVLGNEYDRLDWCVSGLVHSIIGCVLVNLNFTMHIAFFPKSSKERGLSSISIGAIFSVFQICFLVTTFLMPKLLKKIDVWTTLKCSLGAHALVTGLFAFTGRLQNPDAFFFCTMILRGVEGILAASTEVAALEVTKKCVPDDLVGTSVTWIESARTFGIVVGPLTGGGMHHVTGYKGPFIFSGCCLVAIFISSLLFPADEAALTTSYETIKKDLILEMGKPPIFILMVAVIFISCSAITFLEPTLQPMVAEAPYFLNEIEMALVYLCLVIMYGISALLAPAIASKLGNLPTISIGMLFISIGFFTICPPKTLSGPLSLFAFMHQSSERGAISLLITGLCWLGVGGGLALITATLMMVEESEYHGFYSDEAMDAFPQIVNIIYNFGNFLGPFTAGILEDTAGFSKASSIIAYVVLIGAIIVSIVTAIILNRRPVELKSQDENDIDTLTSSLLVGSEDGRLQ